jgi:putative ABC transport system permease protein
MGKELSDRSSSGQVWRENLFQALGVIRAHRLRSSLLIVGVAIGVTTVLAMVTVMSGLGKRVESDITSANRPYLMISRFDPFSNTGDRRDLLRREKLTSADAEAIAAGCKSVDRVDLQISPRSGAKILRYGRERTDFIQIIGTSHNFGSMFSFSVERGRFFTEFELDHKSRVIVLGSGPAEDLFPVRDPIGKVLKIDSHRYRVAGVLESREHFIGGMSDNFAVIPYTVFEKDFSSDNDQYNIAVTVRSGFTMEESREEITDLLRIRRGVKPGEENNFNITTSETFREMISNITRYIGLVLVVISSIGLMVGGIGVMNIMLISVTERTREIGIRMAMGARKKDVMQQFLVEAATLTGIGGLLGTGFGMLAAYGVSSLISFPYSVPVVWIIIAVIASASIGLIFGLYPANRAANMDPIKALHYE